jgi:regulator of sigma E protease
MLAILIAILGLALLMTVHELGHHLVARAFKMRVVRFSIGFGPALWRYQSKKSGTIYQIALIPFLAFVQVDGMNPFEEHDPNDRGSYANGTLTARILQIFAGPLANYVFASVLFFAALFSYGKATLTTKVSVLPDGAAASAQMLDGDEIVEIDGAPVRDFDHLRELVEASPDRTMQFGVMRDGRRVSLDVTPEALPTGGRIGVAPTTVMNPVPLSEAVEESLLLPALVVQNVIVGLVDLVIGKSEAEVGGPVMIVKQGARMAELGGHALLFFLAQLSAYLAAFNLLPLPALDGGRLMFLSYEGITRRKPNPKIEAQIHAVGLLLFLALMVFVTVGDLRG